MSAEEDWPYPELVYPVMMNAYARDDPEGRNSLDTHVYYGEVGEVVHLKPPGKPGTFWVRQTFANGVRIEPLNPSDPTNGVLMIIARGGPRFSVPSKEE